LLSCRRSRLPAVQGNGDNLLYSFDKFRLDTDRRELHRGGELCAVEPQVFDLLECVIRSRHRVVTRDDLLAEVWNGRIVSEATLTSRINAARTAIGDNGQDQRLIRTILRKGIRFVGAVTEEPSSAAASRVDGGVDGQAPALSPPDKPSIAVLPFSNMGADPEQEYFADGMVEDIITGLARIRWLFVIARNSTFTYKGRAIDVKQVGRELGVRYVLEGSVRRASERVRVSAQLIDAATGMHVWAERYDRVLGDVFALQDEITLSVVGAIEPSLRLAEVERVRRKRPDSLGAYELVLQAQPGVYSRMPEHSATALELLERALALDPSYALAHGYAAECHHTLFLRGGLNEAHRCASIRHAEAALAHGRDDAFALALAGFAIGMDKHDRAAAFAAFDTALAISPSSALTYILGSVVLAWAGEAERAIEWSERGLRLSPFDPWRASAHFAAALGHFHLRRYEKAAEAARWAVHSAPGFSISYVILAASLAGLERIDDARAAAARVLDLQPNFKYGRQLAGAGCVPALAGALGSALRDSGLPE
jgi:TolB-like protein